MDSQSLTIPGIRGKSHDSEPLKVQEKETSYVRRTKFKPHEVGMQVSYCMDSDESEEDNICRPQEISRSNILAFLKTENIKNVPIPLEAKTGQFICYNTGQFYLLTTEVGNQGNMEKKVRKFRGDIKKDIILNCELNMMLLFTMLQLLENMGIGRNGARFFSSFKN